MNINNNHGYINKLNSSELIQANGELGALKVVSQQFEAQFLQSLLKQMRAASDAISDDDSPLSAKNDGMFRDWHDTELAGRLSQMQSIGLADIMTKQLSHGLKQQSDIELNNITQNNKSTNLASIDKVQTNAMKPALNLPKNG